MPPRNDRSNASAVSVSTPAQLLLDWTRGGISGPDVRESAKTLGELQGLFGDEQSFKAMDPMREIYRVRVASNVPAGEEGGLLWGVTVLQPGKVGDEFFMTHGHFHADRTRAEFYATVAGEGILLRMDGERRTWGEAMSANTLHYIRGEHAHRVANVGSEPLIFWACWGSDAGYDYKTIRQSGFSARVVERDGAPRIIFHE